jgi:hypothetical protein
MGVVSILLALHALFLLKWSLGVWFFFFLPIFLFANAFTYRYLLLTQQIITPSDK